MFYERRSSVMQTDLQDEMVLIDGDSGAAFRLNESARFVWLQLPATSEALLQAFRGRYNLPEDAARRDLEAAVQSLVHGSLVLARDEP